eukprot:Nk52_evm20s2133 gene=Nk52_evmTU20s2133
MQYLGDNQMQGATQISHSVLCCQCGIPIAPNPANMCAECIRNDVDITEGIPKQSTIHFCKNCERYLLPPATWVVCSLESKELLTLCLKKIKGLSKVRLVDAGFIWTEPHSRRIKVKVTIEKEVYNSAILQQMFVVEFFVATQQCDKCQRTMAEDHWNAIVQVRQKVDHKRTFFYLEQLIIKHQAHSNTLNIKERPDGLDFYYGNRSHAMKMVSFLETVVPCRYKTSERLISSDIQNNTFNYKFTFSTEIVPVCKDDIVCLPKVLSKRLANISPLCLCYRVGNSLHLIDPNTLQVAEVTNNIFWRHPFSSLASRKQQIEYTVLDIEPLGPVRGKFVLAEATVARTRDLGYNDQTFFCRTHLGHILNPGDAVMGFDLGFMNLNNDNFDKMNSDLIPDVVLIRKVYPDRRKKKKKRNWKVKRLNTDKEGFSKKDEEHDQKDFEVFLDDIEEDKDYRSKMALYKEPQAPVAEGAMHVEGEEPDELDIPLDELLDDLTLDDPMAGPDEDMMDM